jgi:hypothetical protein
LCSALNIVSYKQNVLRLAWQPGFFFVWFLVAIINNISIAVVVAADIVYV